MNLLKGVFLGVLSSCIFAQSSPEFALPVELYPIAKDELHSSASTTFIMESVSTVWASDGGIPNYSAQATWISTDYDYLEYSTTRNNSVDYGFNFVRSEDNSGSPDNVFGYGKYKRSVEAGEDSYYLFLDYRDDRIGYYNYLGTPTGSSIDIWVRFDYNDNSFWINSYGFNTPNWVEVTSHSTINFWELKGMGTPSTSKFKPYTPLNLMAEINVGGGAALDWQHHTPSDDYWNQYKIYRCITDSPPATSYTEIGQSSKLSTMFIDGSLTLGTYEAAFYKVAASNAGLLSFFSDSVMFGSPAAPNAPSNGQLSIVSDHPKITWARNTEPNIDEYIVYIRKNGGSWWEQGRVSQTRFPSFIDIHTNTSMPIDDLDYHIIAKNKFELLSGMSSIVSVMGLTAKPVAPRNEEEPVSPFVNKFDVFPNPFNLSTNMRFSIEEDSNVTKPQKVSENS
ncbi:MAG: hypothetical protein U9Q77_11840 [Candidatus Marinimicrobia bacterium]|nr:hypothetical protein [Candidatus Neomarinimicrobiota bacterium]